jgi:hypothetical protein
MANIPLPLHSYSLDTASTARLVNVMTEAAPPGAKAPIIMRRSPGIRPYLPCGNGPGRGMHVLAGVLYAVSGAQLYRVKTQTAMGTVFGSNLTTSINSATQLAISSGGRLYGFDGVTVTQANDPDLAFPLGPIDFIDNYLVAVHAGTGQFIASALADFTQFDGLDFATAEGAPDNLITLIVDHRAILLGGEETGELWENIAGTGFPFQRIANGFFELGFAAANGVCKQDNSVFWVASDRTFRRLVGPTPLRVSQFGVDRAWRAYSSVADAYCVPYTLEGHLCIGVNFPTAQASWIYDITANEWNERETHPTTFWDVSAIVELNETIYVQRASTGEIGILDPKTYTEWGRPLRAQWAYQPLYAQGDFVQVHRLQMGVEAGVGADYTTVPRVELERSRLSGRAGTFRPVGSRSLGLKGQYGTLLHWDGLGQGLDPVFRASLSAPVPLTLWDTVADIEVLKT